MAYYNSSKLISRREIIFVTSILVLMLALMLTSVINKSPTYDEVIHVPIGFTYWMTGGFTMDAGAPPGIKMLMTWPLLFMHLNFRTEGQAWIDANDLIFSHTWLFSQNDNPDSIVNTARFVIMLLSVLLGLLIWRWTRELFGPLAAGVAVFIYAFEPTIIAHSQLATLDIGTAFFGFLALWLLRKYLLQRTFKTLLLAAISFGAYQVTKFSGVVFIIIFVLLLIMNLVTDARNGKPWPWRLLIRDLIVFSVVAYFVIACVYRFDRYQIVTGEERIMKFEQVLKPLGPVEKPLMWFLTKPKIVAGRWWSGMIWQIAHSRRGHPAYLFGNYSQQGWWYYYPVAYFLKTPIPMLMMLLAGAFAFMRIKRISSFDRWFLMIPFVVFGFFMITNRIDLGVRYLLPVYPIIIIMAASLVPSSLAQKKQLTTGAVTVLMLAWLAVESLSIYPDYLTYFNQFAGGPRGGIRYLADSNVDWGQDLKGLAHYVNKNKIKKITMSYFGTANPDNYRFPYRIFTDRERHNYTPGIYAVSVNNLLCVFTENKTDYAWLKKRKPTDVIGNSIYVYRVER